MDTQPITTSQPPISSTPVVPNLASESVRNFIPAPKSSYLLPIILSSLVTALILVAAYFVFFSNTPQTITASPSPTPNPSPSTISFDPTSTWETYSNANSLTFKYPAEYTLKETNESINVQKNPTRALLYIALLSNPKNLSADKWFDSQSADIRQPILDTHTRSAITVDNQTAVKFTKQDGSQDFLVVFVEGNKGYFAYFGPTSTDELVTANQILSTFKLTSNNSSIPEEINKVFTAINKDFGVNVAPTHETEFYSLQGFIKKESWKLDLLNMLTDKPKTTQLYKILDQYLKQDINSSADGVGQSVQGYENDQVYCFFLRGFNQSDYLSCILK